jgi:hypothetical protein
MQAAREAIRAIQGKLGDVEGGRLSVATEGAAAGLSVVQEEGSLSLAREPAASGGRGKADP